ncbi:MAG: flagellar motor switch protein FliM, partial [Phycisphaerae bacterium]|nr:flagellar motor switch protein FliM [Phycisphaerae bacterium]
QTLHDTFSRNFGVSLSGFLRTIVEVRVAHAEQMTYSEFIAGLPNPTSFNLINAEQLDGQLCFEISPLIIYPIIDRLLGGSNQDLFIPQRPMTLIETRLIETILERAMTALSEAWEGIKKIDFRLGDMESNPQIMQIVPPNEVVVVVGFEVKMTSRAGTMSLCIPFNAIESLIDDLSTQSWFLAGKLREDAHWGGLIADRLSDAQLEVEGILGETTITVADLRGLEVGDIITTEKRASDPIILTAGGIPKFFAQIGQLRGRRALRIDRPVTVTDRIEGD